MAAGSEKPFSVVLIGGGITGIALTIALLKRGIDVRIYEQAPQFTEIGAGIAFSPNAKQAMVKCDPSMFDVYQRVATKSGAAAKLTTWYDWVDSYNTYPEGSKLQFTIDRNSTADGCHRAHFLEELLTLIPENVAYFNKRLDKIEESDTEGPLIVRFEDGTTTEADVVIGCDGIKSKVRRQLVGDSSPKANPSYSHRYAYRGLIPMEKAIAAIGPDLAVNRIMHMGQDGHILTFPVAHGKTMNVVAFQYDPNEWKSEGLVVPTTREEALRDFAGWGVNAKAILSLLPDTMTKWAIFDLGDHPLDHYNQGRICLAGDAAHATSPHHGAGAGFCIEDSAILAELLLTAKNTIQTGKSAKPIAQILQDALTVFDHSRRERTQWLIDSSRVSADLYEWRHEGCGRDPAKIKEELLWRNNRIWQVDIDKLAATANEELEGMVL